MIHDETIRTLTRLGLTSCQAKVYLALVGSGIATAKTISKTSSVTREDVYRIIPTLEKLGLVERAIASPAVFEAVPMQKGVSILIARKRIEYDELQARTKELLKNFKNNNAKAPLLEEENSFVLIPGKERVIQRRLEEIDASRTSVDLVTLGKRVQHTIAIYCDGINKAIKRGVKFRVVTEKPDKNYFTQTIRAFRNNPSFRIRHAVNPPDALVAIHDSKRVLISTSAEAGLGDAPDLWSSNRCVLGLAQNYFEILWTTSTEDKT